MLERNDQFRHNVLVYKMTTLRLIQHNRGENLTSSKNHTFVLQILIHRRECTSPDLSLE